MSNETHAVEICTGIYDSARCFQHYFSSEDKAKQFVEYGNSWLKQHNAYLTFGDRVHINKKIEEECQKKFGFRIDCIYGAKIVYVGKIEVDKFLISK